jgi:hypothetical protein
VTRTDTVRLPKKAHCYGPQRRGEAVRSAKSLGTDPDDLILGLKEEGNKSRSVLHIVFQNAINPQPNTNDCGPTYLLKMAVFWVVAP